MSSTDFQIRRNVLDELRLETSINADSINVEAEEGVVRLSGCVDSDAEKWLVEKAAGRIGGVTSLINKLKVMSFQRQSSTDDDIGRECENVLQISVPSPNEKIRVMVSNGWVTLSGSVAWGYERWAAEAAVSNLRGVTGVNSQITVRPLVIQDDVDTNIDTALFEMACRGTGITSNLHAAIARDQVTLSGVVQSRSESKAARNAALSTPGVNKVIDHTVLAQESLKR